MPVISNRFSHTLEQEVGKIVMKRHAFFFTSVNCADFFLLQRFRSRLESAEYMTLVGYTHCKGILFSLFLTFFY